MEALLQLMVAVIAVAAGIRAFGIGVGPGGVS
jgi:hypothetical protein